MHMEVRALFGRNVWRTDRTNNLPKLAPLRFLGSSQAHTEGVQTQPGRTRFNGA